MSAMSGAAARDQERGARILVVSWVANALFAVTAIPAALGVSAFDVPAIAVALGLFAISLGVWCWAFAVALARTTRGDDVVVASMFLVQGPAPQRPVRAPVRLLGGARRVQLDARRGRDGARHRRDLSLRRRWRRHPGQL